MTRVCNLNGIHPDSGPRGGGDLPLVSVVMPVYNAAPWIDLAVEGARAQNWPRLELVAVDDGSTDGSGPRLDDLAAAWTGEGRSAQVIHQANAGAAAARNAGIAAAGGDFIALLDADDLYDPDLVGACMEKLRGDSGADVACALSRIRDAGDRVVHRQAPLPERLDALDLLDGRMVNRPVLRRDAIEAVGGHDPDLRIGIDLDLFMRLSLRRPGCIVTVPRCLSDYRRHPGQITADWRRVEQGWQHGRDTLARARPDIPPSRFTRAHARKCLYWAELAYGAGDYAGARHLIRTALRHVPVETLSRRQGWIRTASCIASLLPAPLHDGIRRRFNARGAT